MQPFETCAGPSGLEVPWSTAVLAGGRGSRFGGMKFKARVDGISLIRRVVAASYPPSADLMVVLGRENTSETVAAVLDELGDVPARVVVDPPGAPGVAAGIEAALGAARFDRVLVVAADLPFLHRDFLRVLVERSSESDAAVPFHDGFYEPACAVYRKSFLPVIAAYRRKLEGPLWRCFEAEGVRVARVDEETIRRFGPPEVIFFNVNTREDLARAELIAARNKEGKRRD